VVKPSVKPVNTAEQGEAAAAEEEVEDEAAAAADVMCSLGELTEQLAGAASDADEAEEEKENEGEATATSPKKAAAAPAAPAAVPGRKKKVLTVAAAPAGTNHPCPSCGYRCCASCDALVGGCVPASECR
jgi:hypothetical protein